MGLDDKRHYLCVWSNAKVWKGIICLKLLKATEVTFSFDTPNGNIVTLPVRHLSAKSSNNVVLDWLSDKSNQGPDGKWDIKKFASKSLILSFHTSEV